MFPELSRKWGRAQSSGIEGPGTEESRAELGHGRQPQPRGQRGAKAELAARAQGEAGQAEGRVQSPP